MRALGALTLALAVLGVGGKTYELSDGDDYQEKCLDQVVAGDTCVFYDGEYPSNGLTQAHGTEDKRITLTLAENATSACLKGDLERDRLLQIAHDYYTISGLCFDGKHDNDYTATAIYVLGAEKKSSLTKNGVTVDSSVTGTQLFDLEIKNFGSECVHFRYSVTWSEVQGCTVQHCGIEAFVNGGGGKVGECFYVGTALDQVDDGKTPEPQLWTGSPDNVESDNCAYNHIHHNTLRSYGNECVDVKEGSMWNLIESNVCEHQQDENSGGFDLRGDENTVRYNEIAECKGAAIRLGGDKEYGSGNHCYGNEIVDMGNGAFNVMAPDQGTVCENSISDATSAEGSYKTEPQFALSVSTGACDEYPGDLPGVSSSPSSTPDDDSSDSPSSSAYSDDSEGSAGVNYSPSADESEPTVVTVEINSFSNDLEGDPCDNPLSIANVEIEHAGYAAYEPENLFDGDFETYFSVHRESTSLTFELEDVVSVQGVSIGFYMNEGEDRVQTFSIDVKESGDDEWITVIDKKESTVEHHSMQQYTFYNRDAQYVRFSSHGNTFNNWTPLEEFQVCGASESTETNALFHESKKNVQGELQSLASDDVCPEPTELRPVETRLMGGIGDVSSLFDRNYNTRWTAEKTQMEYDLDNDQVHLKLQGDSYLSYIKLSFYDAELANQYFSVYTQAARAREWSPALTNRTAARNGEMQQFDIEQDRVTHVYIVGKGNEVGVYTKISEIQLYGCDK